MILSILIIILLSLYHKIDIGSPNSPNLHMDYYFPPFYSIALNMLFLIVWNIIIGGFILFGINFICIREGALHVNFAVFIFSISFLKLIRDQLLGFLIPKS